MRDDEAIAIPLAGGRAVSGLWTAAADARWSLVYAPGAGSNLSDGFGQHAARVLPPQGISVLRFQFPYSEAGRGLPDRPPVLESTWKAAISAARDRAERLVIGGRSMGGRIASQVVADGEPVQGLALFAYPLHPPGQPDRRRDQHFSQIAVPTLFCSGTRDAFATPDELRAAASRVPRATLHFLDDADHGFAVAKRTGRTQQQVWDQAIEAFLRWIGTLT
jgi:predicted alpha/beta-hydrolase family hydrolase